MRNSAEFITKKSSFQTYITVKLLVDKHLIQDCFRAYAYFRWFDDQVDVVLKDKISRQKFVKRQKRIIDETYADKRPARLKDEEKFIVELIRNNPDKKSKLYMYISNFFEIIAFDALRKGNPVTQKELSWYSLTLSKAVTSGIEAFINSDFQYPESKAHYVAGEAAHLAHMLRDYREDLEEEYFNVPIEFLKKNRLKPEDVYSPTFKKWVKKEIETSRRKFGEGMKYINGLPTLRSKIAATWYCARFDGILKQIESDGYNLREKYPKNHGVGSWVKFVGLALKSSAKHFVGQKQEPEKKVKSAAIIGAGIGGLATAILLAKKGLEVSVYEKNKVAGGRCGRIIRDGHIFDTGPTMYLFPGLYKTYFEAIGEKIDDHLELLRTDPTYKLFLGNKKLTLTSDQEIMRDQLESLEKGSYEKFLKYLNYGKEHYKIAIGDIIKRCLDNPLEYFNTKNLYRLIKSGALNNHYSLVSRLFKHPLLRAGLTFQDSYLGLNPVQSPAIYSLFAYSEMDEGSYLPKGGMYEVIASLEKIAKRCGVKINYSCDIRKIETGGKKAAKLILNKGKVVEAGVFVANSDLVYTYNNLLPKTRKANRLQMKPHSCSALVFHWGLDKEIPELMTHNLFFSNNYQESFDQVVDGKTPPADPHFYIQAPSRTDQARAPKGQDTLTVMIPINHNHKEVPVDWKRYSTETRKYILNKLTECGIEEIEKHIKFELIHTPDDWQNFLNLPQGSVYGLHHNLTQIGYLRPKRVHHRYSNLFFVGADNHPGSGLPTVLTSSLFTAEKVMTYAGSKN